MSILEFVKKYGVKRKNVEKWIKDGWLPGVYYDEATKNWVIPNSARRPYKSRYIKPTATATELRSHVVKACIKRKHISPLILYTSRGEFDALIKELIQARLIVERVEDGVTYYDSTKQADTYDNKPMKYLRKFVLECVEAAARGVVNGVLTKNVV